MFDIVFYTEIVNDTLNKLIIRDVIKMYNIVFYIKKPEK